MKIIVCDNYEEMSKEAAKIFADVIKSKPNAVLGLATGSTPIGMYNELAAMNKSGEIDFSNITTFNLDEYYPIKRTNEQSYYYFMNENLFSKINIDRDNTHIPDGQTDNPDEECASYEESITEAGGIDIQILGIGQNGHIGFNEPDSTLNTHTHLTTLTQNTIQANARFFDDISEVPTSALTMGIATILQSKKIVLLASGKSKHNAVASLMTKLIDTEVPATMLKLHPDVTLICDKEAYSNASLGIDIGGTDIKIGVMKNNEIVETEQFSALETDSAEEFIDYLAKSCKNMIDKHSVTKVGIGVPGCIRNKKVSSVNLPFNETPLGEILAQKLKLPVKMENDANCAAFGESQLGEGKDYKNQIMITLGTGIGGGIVLKNKIYHGKGDAGEIGHIIIEKDGRKCPCGQEGCFEQYASVGALSRDAEKLALENKDSVLYRCYSEHGNVMNGKVVFKAYDEGCAVAKKAVDDFISYLAVGITSMIRVFSPDLVVLSGGITAEGDKILKPLCEQIKLDVPIKISSLKKGAGVVGAALL